MDWDDIRNEVLSAEQKQKLSRLEYEANVGAKQEFIIIQGTLTTVSEGVVKKEKHVHGTVIKVYGLLLKRGAFEAGLRVMINKMVQIPSEYTLEGRTLWCRRLLLGDTYWVRYPTESFEQRIRRVWK